MGNCLIIRHLEGPLLLRCAKDTRRSFSSTTWEVSCWPRSVWRTWRLIQKKCSCMLHKTTTMICYEAKITVHGYLCPSWYDCVHSVVWLCAFVKTRNLVILQQLSPEYNLTTGSWLACVWVMDARRRLLRMTEAQESHDAVAEHDSNFSSA